VLLSRRAVMALSGAVVMSSGLAKAAHARGRRSKSLVKHPIVIGHRGCSGERPEHTLASYSRAIEQGADFIEPDLVLTSDGHFIARHENEISGTTDVANRPEFAARKATKTIDGSAITGWFTEDFTLAEIKTLRARERLPQLRPANTAFDGQFDIPTLDEVWALAKAHKVGIYPELKHPTYFASQGLPMESRLADAIRAAGLNSKSAPIFIQCFETGALKTMRRLVNCRQIFLVDSEGGPADLVLAGDKRTYADLITPQGLKAIAEFADGIGPFKDLILPRDANANWTSATRLIPNAHAAGLLVHPWTFRAENNFLPTNHRQGDPTASDFLGKHGDMVSEIRQFLDLGVDGVFSDFPGLAVAALHRA
jgi:glycerophosphoryl diester phosphodiesterase